MWFSIEGCIGYDEAQLAEALGVHITEAWDVEDDGEDGHLVSYAMWFKEDQLGWLVEQFRARGFTSFVEVIEYVTKKA